MAPCKIHNVGFYAPEPKAIYCMALQKKEGKLAVARSDASIEIWNLNHIPFIERTIPSNLENFSIEGLCWHGNRLFSVGLHGWLVEYDLDTLSVKNKWSITGEVGTCLDINKTHITVGTDQGYINIYDITEDGVQFEKFLDKQEGRVLCLKYNADGKFVVAGSINAVRIWNVKTGHAIHKMLLGRSEAKKDTVVWCLEVMKDFTIFSGDSRGVLTLWDGKLGAQIESYQSHKADITALCVDEGEQTIYAAGVDPSISNYQKIKVGTNVKWVKSIQRKIHEHDVRAMVFHRGKLYSAGVDSYLVCSYHPPKTLIKHAPVLQSPCVQVPSKGGSMILLRYSKHIELWRLGTANQAEPHYQGLLELKSKPKKLLVVQKIGKNWANEDEAEAIVCSCIAAGGRWIFLGTCTGFRLYVFLMYGDKPKLTKVEDLDDDNVPCVQAAFNDTRDQLIVALNNGTLVVYDLEDLNPFISQRIERNKEHLTDTVSLMTVSNCGKYLVVADCKNNIVVYQHTKDGYSFHLKLPRSQIPSTAIAVNSLTCCIIVAYADNSMHEYDLETEKFTNFSKKLEQSGSWKSKTHIIRSITFDSRNKSAVLVHDDSNIIVITRDGTSTTSNAKSKIAKTDEEPALTNGDVHSAGDLKISTIPKFKHLVYIAPNGVGQLVAVQVNPLSILEKLPAAFAQKTFGTK